MSKLKTFQVEYTFDGRGVATVTAKNEEEAKDKFFEGEFSDDQEITTDYHVSSVSIS